jgi:hypothetical protein
MGVLYLERQHFVEQLKHYGELFPSWNIKIWVGQKVSEMISFAEGVKLRGFILHPDKYYIFETDKGQIFVCDTPEEAVDMASKYSPFDFNIINIGDYVDFGHYGKFYVCGENIGGTKFLVTGNPGDRFKRTENSFYIEKRYAENIIEK